MLGAIGVGEKRKLRLQKEAAEHAAATEYKYGEMAADNAMARSVEMFEIENAYNTPTAQAERMRDAQLSVGLMYGGGGAGGEGKMSNGPQGHGATVGVPDVASISQAMTQQRAFALQAAKMNSEIAVNESVAEKNTADAKYTSGVETDQARTGIDKARKEMNKIDTEIDKLSADITKTIEETGNIKLMREGIRYQNKITEVQSKVAEATTDTQIKSAEEMLRRTIGETQKLIREIDILEVQKEISYATKKSMIDMIKEQLTNLTADTAVKYAQEKAIREDTKLTNKQIYKIIEEVDQKWAEIKISAVGNAQKLILTAIDDLFNSLGGEEYEMLNTREARQKRMKEIENW